MRGACASCHLQSLLIRFTRPDIAREAPWANLLPILGIVWLVFTVVLYWFAGINPILNFVGIGKAESQLDYLNRTGVTMTILIFALGLVIFAIQSFRNRRAGIDTSLMYQELPPD